MNSKKILISYAKPDDATAMIAVIQSSITHLCAADHENDRQELYDWLNNKTHQNMLTWIADDQLFMMKTMIDGQIVSVGCANNAGRILMNYVAPKYQYQGISKMMMQKLEACLLSVNIKIATLESSKTAYKFYIGLNWRKQKSIGCKIEMQKTL